MQVPIAVTSSEATWAAAGQELAATLHLPFLPGQQPADLPAGQWLLIAGPGGLAMQATGPRAAGPVMVDFVGGKLGFRRRRPQATPDLVKAVGLRSGIYPEVWDMTAGLGQDAFILACYGCQLRLFERNPLVHCLLADGLARARAAAQSDAALKAVVERMHLSEADSIAVLRDLPATERPGVIYIDTMFPERSKSAKVKKGMQLFQQLVGEDADAAQLLELALQRAQFRVVVKRPRHAAPLADQTAPLQLSGKSIRFDVYPLRKLVPAGV